jgi:hypothetical protein
MAMVDAIEMSAVVRKIGDLATTVRRELINQALMWYFWMRQT